MNDHLNDFLTIRLYLDKQPNTPECQAASEALQRLVRRDKQIKKMLDKLFSTLATASDDLRTLAEQGLAEGGNDNA